MPQERAWKIIVFGSSPLQLAIDPNFLTAYVDIISSPDLDQYCEAAGLLKGQAPVYIDLCTAAAFTASADWMIRAYSVTQQHITFVLPHPVDILVSKVKRLEEKDLNAFRLMQAKTGHPTEEELLIALRRVVDMYWPGFDEESGDNPRQNTQVLWQELFGNTTMSRNSSSARLWRSGAKVKETTITGFAMPWPGSVGLHSKDN